MLVEKTPRPPRLQALLLAALILLLPATTVADRSLDLPAAEALALRHDPLVEQFHARSEALRERSVAAAQLPDPMLKLGAVALPTDTFDLDQEAMTQLQLGMQQRFLPGDTLEIRAEQLRSRAESMSLEARDQQLAVELGVREAFLEVLYRAQATVIIEKTHGLFADLLEISREYYATGVINQQDVYRAQLELSRLDDRAHTIAQAEEEARARLGLWIGAAAQDPLRMSWPELPEPPEPAELQARLTSHPRVLAAHAAVMAAERGVDIVGESYKPAWSLELTYGRRAGIDLVGRSRPDLVTAMATVELPLFRRNRQDRELAASLYEAEAAVELRNDALRRLRADLDGRLATQGQLALRRELFEQRLLPQAIDNSEAALAAYQSGVEDFTTLMRAWITHYELQLEHARILADELKTRAGLLYLAGESS